MFIRVDYYIVFFFFNEVERRYKNNFIKYNHIYILVYEE